VEMESELEMKFEMMETPMTTMDAAATEALLRLVSFAQEDRFCLGIHEFHVQLGTLLLEHRLQTYASQCEEMDSD
jgi:hypothetical protein